MKQALLQWPEGIGGSMRMAKAAKAATAKQPAASAKEDKAAVPTKTKGAAAAVNGTTAAAVSLKQMAAGRRGSKRANSR